MRVLGVLQARMGSSRLPGKVLMDLAGRPVLEWAVRRLRRAATLDELVVATSTRPEDDEIEMACAHWRVDCFRGSAEDVLDRFYQLARSRSAEVVVRLTGDDPLVDPVLVDRVVTALLDSDPPAAYASNVVPRRTYPRGLDTEAIRFAALEQAWRDDRDPRLREHVTQYIVRHPELFPAVSVENPVDLSAQRWAVDTVEDLAFLRAVCDHLGNEFADWGEIAALVASNPAWVELNRHVQQRTV